VATRKNLNQKKRGDHYNPGNMSGKTVSTHKDESEANKKSPNPKQRGDHFNPGNMSGKTVSTPKDESEQSNADRLGSRQERQHKKSRL
jgi:hypothetical protein